VKANLLAQYPLKLVVLMDYYQIRRISNSDLTAFKHKLLGMPQKLPTKALSFGTALHTLLLEPHKMGALPADVDEGLLNRLGATVLADRQCRWYLRYSRKEQVELFEDAHTGLPCKAKLDIIYRRSTVLDFKTTSTCTAGEFAAKCLRYDYDRQAAFYLDAIGGKRFIFVGIQKVKPYGLFRLEATATPGFVEYGRKKYQALLKKWKEVHGESA
jgi:hypothetical protein